MKSNHLIVDGQVFQTGAKDRGMGRYAICLLQALLRQPGLTMELILSKNLPIKRGLQAELRELFPEVTLTELPLWSLNSHPIEQAIAHNQKELTSYISRRKKQDASYFIPALFQDPAVSVFPQNVRAKTVLFHDLIPYLYHGRYEKFMGFTDYLKRFRFIFEADIIFTNSQTVADDLNMYLGVQKHKLCRIDGAAIMFDKTIQKPDVPIDKPFILFNTSDDPRKNNLRTVLAFEEYRIATKSDVMLVATSTINRAEQEKLRSITKNIVFTGNIPSPQLNWLFANCEAVLFVSESEGLGLPLLEAVEFNKKVIASSISVLREISPDPNAFFFCDHENAHAIAKTIERALSAHATVNKKAYQAIRDYYTWDNTAKRLLTGLNAFVPRERTTKKPKVAVFTAIPSGLSGVGLTHAAILHPSLIEQFDVEYYMEKGLSGVAIRPDYLQYAAPCYPAQSFSIEKYRQYDAVLYHLGNGEYHLETIKNALYLPGYAIVHDTHMVEAFRVLRETGMMSKERTELEARLDELNDTKMSNYYTSVVNRQLGVITHSVYAADAMKEVLKRDVPVVASHLATNVPDLENVRPSDKVTVGLAGAIADVKGLDVIETIAEDATFDNCNIRLFGFNHASPDRLAKLAQYDNVAIATNVSDFEFQTNVGRLDIFVNYRMTYKGESSNATLEAMRQGAVVIVRNVGWFSELPDDAVVKVDDPESVLVTLRELVKDADRMRTIGKRAKEFVAKRFTYEQYVTDIRELVEHSMNNATNPNTTIAKSLKAGEATSPQALVNQIKGSY